MKNKKILLINPPSFCVEDDRMEPPLGILYIAANLRENGYRDVSVYDMTGCKNEKQIKNKIDQVPCADIYGVSSFSTNYNYAKRVIDKIREVNPSAYIAIGGSNPTGVPDFTLTDSGADAVMIGEGEDSFMNWVESIEPSSPRKQVVEAELRQDIDSYPFPARDLVDMGTYSRKLLGQPVVSMISSRGCKHHCIHCNSVIMGGGSRGARYRSAQNIIDEIEPLRDRFSCFRFNDDHFTGNPELHSLLERMKELDITFRIFTRIEDLDAATCQLLKEAGCVHVSVGLESLNLENLRLLGKGAQIGQEANVNIAKSHGLVIRASFMVGLPYDTDESINKYFNKAAELGIDEFAIYPLIPYPGTTIWKLPGEFGYSITNRDFTDYVQMGKGGKTCYSFRHENFTPEDMKGWKLEAEKILKSGGAKHMRESEVAQ